MRSRSNDDGRARRLLPNQGRGVCRILAAVDVGDPSTSCSVYTTQGKWLTPSQAARHCWDVAASNWHGLASYALRWTGGKEPALLVDVGSTTIDLIPLSDDQVRHVGHDRWPALARRTTPLHGHRANTPVRSRSDAPFSRSIMSIMNEFFAPFAMSIFGSVNWRRLPIAWKPQMEDLRRGRLLRHFVGSHDR